MTPINATASIRTGQDSKIQQNLRIQDTVDRELLYTQDSNTVFYYNDYRVVLLLDFSQSTTTIYQTQEKTYLEKMRDCLSFIIENLLFQIKNQFKKQSSRDQQSNPGGVPTNGRKSSDFAQSSGLVGLLEQPLNLTKYNNNSGNGIPRCQTSDDSQEEESDFGHHTARNLPGGHLSTLEEQYESGTTLPPMPRFSDHRNNTAAGQTATTNSKNVTTARSSSMAQPPQQTTIDNSNSGTDFNTQNNSKTKQEAPNKNNNANTNDQNYYHKQKAHEKDSYSPRVYLSIIVSGIPPGNHIKIIMHNQKLDLKNLKELLKEIDGHLIRIERDLKNNIKLTNDDVFKDQPACDIQGSLQAHLKNAQYILDLMNQDAKPLLVFFTDCSSSLFELHHRIANHKINNSAAQNVGLGIPSQSNSYWQQSGQLDATIHRLHVNDTQLISIDLTEENKVCQQFGFLNHENELDYLTSITQGLSLTYSKLMDIKLKINLERGNLFLDKQSAFLTKKLFEREDKVKFEIKNGFLNVMDPYAHSSSAANNKRGQIIQQNNAAQAHALIQRNQFGTFCKRGKDHINKPRQINSLQKIMFSRASNYKHFLHSQEIKNLLGERYSADKFLLKSQIKQKTSEWSDMSVSQLLLQNKIVPILESEGLAEYVIRKVGFASLIEFRSKMGFKFSKVEYSEARKEQSHHQVLMQEKVEYERSIKSIEYKYWVGSTIFITCVLSLEPISQSKEVNEDNKIKLDGSDKAHKNDRIERNDKIYVSYDLYAPAENLKSINREKILFKKQMQALEQMNLTRKRDLKKARQEKTKQTLYGRIHTFINSIYDRDCHFQLLEKIRKVLQQAYPKLDETTEQDQTGSSKPKFKDQNFVKMKNAPKTNHHDYKEDLQAAKIAEGFYIESQSDQKYKKKDKQKKKLKKNKETDHKNTEETARKLLTDNKILWERLSKRIASNTHYYQWKCYFRYAMFTIMTQTNRSVYKYDQFEGQKNERKWRNGIDLEKIWVQDRQIERKLFEDFRNFTTFTLNRDTFMNVWVENQSANQYKIGNNHQRQHQNVLKGEESDVDIGFCLIKLKWIASNVAECHFGFYQVGPKQRLAFIKKMKKELNKTSQSTMDDQKLKQWLYQDNQKHFIVNENGEKSLPFYCYSKNITSLLIRHPQRQISKQKKIEKHYLDNAFSDSEDSENQDVLLENQFARKETLKKKRALRQQQEQRKAEEMHQQMNYRKNQTDSLLQTNKNMLLFSGAEPISSNTVHTSLHDLWQQRFGFGRQGLQPNRNQLFHQFEWRWENLNEKTNKEFFNHVLSYRLSDGFIIVNRYTGTGDYFHLVKVLRAYKDRFGQKRSKVTGNQSEDKYRDTKNEKVEIVVQYIIEHYTEKIQVNEADQASVQDKPQLLSIVKAKLLMEKETSFFNVEKGEKVSMSRTGSVFSYMPRQKRQTRGKSAAMSRNSSLSKNRSLQNKSQSRDSRISKGSGQLDQNQSSEGASECKSGKDFFYMMRDYMQEVDQFLRKNTCTYHHIVKNSIKVKVDESNKLLRKEKEEALQTQLCYFRNIQASTRRQRRQLEDSIREKMLILHSDWSSFLTEQYPELQQNNEQGNVLGGIEAKIAVSQQILEGKKDAHDDKSFNIEQLLQNSKHFATQRLQAPLLDQHHDQTLQSQLQRQINTKYLEQVVSIFKGFADLKIDALDYEQQTTDVYCKLLTKRYLLLIQVPTIKECKQLLEENEPIQVNYFKFNQDMIKVPEVFKRGAVHKFLSQQEANHKKRIQQNSRIKNLSRNNLTASFNYTKSELKMTKIINDDEKSEEVGRTRVDSMTPVDQQTANSTFYEQPFNKIQDTFETSGSHQASRDPKIRSPTSDHEEDLTLSTLQKENLKSPQTAIECSSEPGNVLEKSLELIESRHATIKLNSEDRSSAKSNNDKAVDEIVSQAGSRQAYNGNYFGNDNRYLNEDIEVIHSSDEDFEISQIDQKEQVRWYYDHLYRRGRQRERVEFETKVSQIAKNFLGYLSCLFEKAFTEIVLFTFQENHKKQLMHQEQLSANEESKVSTTEKDISNLTFQSMEKKTQQEYQHLKLRKQDFEKAVRSMGSSNFRIDLNFAFLIYYQILKGQKRGANSEENSKEMQKSDQTEHIDKGEKSFINKSDDVIQKAPTKKDPSSEDQIKLLRQAQDLIFEETIKRNFSRCPVDSKFYIYSDNLEDSYINGIKPSSSCKHAQKQNNSQKNSLQLKKEIFAHYQGDLKGTQDAYSDDELASSGQNQNFFQPAESRDYTDVYSSCKNLLFEVTGVIKDSSGAPIDVQPISSLSQIFDMAIQQEGLVTQMVKKAKAQDQRNCDRMNQFKKLVNMKNQAVRGVENESKNVQDQNNQANKEEIDKVSQSYIDSKAGVDIHFRFYTVPKYVGLIQSQSVDFFRDESDDILVNDDFQEDLLRVCRLFKLFDCFIPEEKVAYSPPLFRKLKKIQIIKAIPWYFTHMTETEDSDQSFDAEISMDRNDHRVFWYDKIQRRIIYGILRRTYAIIAECICEMMTMIQSQMLSSIAMVQKYLGHLLYNQRHEKELILFTEEDQKRFPLTLKQMLAQELQKNKVVRSAHFHKNQNTCQDQHQRQIQGKKSSLSRLDPKSIDQVLNQTIFYLSGSYDQSIKDDKDKCWIEFDLIPEWEAAQHRNISDKSQCVKFWCFFMVNSDFKLCYTYYLPKFKQTSGKELGLTNTAVFDKLNQFAISLRSRIKKLLLLEEINKQKELKGVKLEGMAPKYQYLVDNMVRYQRQYQEHNQSVTVDTGNATQGLNSSLTQKSFASQSMQNQTIQSNTSKPKVALKSKFSRGFDKHQQQSIDKQEQDQLNNSNVLDQSQKSAGFGETSSLLLKKKKLSQNFGEEQSPLFQSSASKVAIENQSVTSLAGHQNTSHLNESQQFQQVRQSHGSIVEFNDGVSTTKMKTPIIPIGIQVTSLVEKDMDMLDVFEDLTTVVRTTHQMSAAKALGAVIDEFENLTIYDQANMFVVEKDKTINLIRLTNIGKELLPQENEEELTGQQERILMEVLGVDRPNQDYFLSLKQIIEKQLQQKNMTTIAESYIKTNKQLQQPDIDYIQKTPQKRLLMFPVHKILTDKLALLNHLKQSLFRKFLNQIKLDRKKLESQQKSQQHYHIIPKKLESAENNESNDQQQITYDENQEQLLFNYRVSHEHGDASKNRNLYRQQQTRSMKGQMGELFGFSLALLSFGIIENLTDQDMDNMIVGKSESQAFEAIKEVTVKSFDFNSSNHEQKMASKTLRKEKKGLLTFSIPQIYGISGQNESKSEFQNDLCVFKKYEQQEDFNLNFDERVTISTDKQEHYWVKITIFIQGNLKEDLFIKTLTLVLNQAFTDYMIELHLSQKIYRQPQKELQQYENYKGLQIASQYEPYTKNGEDCESMLDQLFEASLATQSPLSRQTKIKLKGDAVHINQDFTFGLIRDLQSLFRKELKTQIENLQTSTQNSADKSLPKTLESQLSFLVIIKKISNNDNIDVGTVLLKIPVTEKFSTKIVYKAFQKHIKRQITLMQNIRVEFQIVISSYQMPLTLEFIKLITKSKNFAHSTDETKEFQQEEARESNEFHVIDLTMPADSSSEANSPNKKFNTPNTEDLVLSQLNTSPQRSVDIAAKDQLCQLNYFKGFNSIEVQVCKKVQVGAEVVHQKQLPLVQPRNFFIRVNINQDRVAGHPKSRPQLTLESFNLSSAMSFKLNQLVERNIDTNAQSYDKHMKKIAEVQGIMYALPDFFDYNRDLDQGNSQLIDQNRNPSISGGHNMSTISKVTANNESGGGAISDIQATQIVQQQQYLAVPPTSNNKNQHEIGRNNKHRRRRKKRTQKIMTESSQQFNATTWFKSYFDNFLTKEQQLKKVTQIEDLEAIQLQHNRKERSTSQLRQGGQQSQQISSSMVKKSFNQILLNQ